MEKIYVIAGNAKEFNFWCNENKVSPHSPLVSYVHDVNCLRGLRNPRIEVYGTYRARKDKEELDEVVRHACRPPEPKVIYVNAPIIPRVEKQRTFSTVEKRAINWDFTK
jgi:hypothetical protein